MLPGPALIATASILTGLLFVHVARRSHQLPTEPSLSRGTVGLATAWAALAFIAINDAGRIIIGAYTPIPFIVYSGLAYGKIVATGVLIWGLGVHVARAWSNEDGWEWRMATFSAAHALFFVYAYYTRNAVGLTQGTWVPRLVFDGPHLMPAPMGFMALALYFVPPVVLVILYAAQARRVACPFVRQRLRAVAISIGAFQVANMYHSNPSIPGDAAVFPVLATATLASGLIAAYGHRRPGPALASRIDAATTGPPNRDRAPATGTPGDTLK